MLLVRLYLDLCQFLRSLHIGLLQNLLLNLSANVLRDVIVDEISLLGELLLRLLFLIALEVFESCLHILPLLPSPILFGAPLEGLLEDLAFVLVRQIDIPLSRDVLFLLLLPFESF